MIKKINFRLIRIILVVLAVLVLGFLFFFQITSNKYKADINFQGQVIGSGLEESISGWDFDKTYLNNENVELTSESPIFDLTTVDGRLARKISGDKQFAYNINKTIQLQPTAPTVRKKYRLSFDLKYDNRQCFNFEGYANYPGNVDYAARMSGLYLYCGAYFSSFNEPSFPIRRPIFNDQWNSVIITSPPTRDWYNSKIEFTSMDSTIDFRFRIEGFIGNIYMDNLQIEEIDSFLTNEEMKIPIDYTELATFTEDLNQKTVTTQKTEFRFDNSKIYAKLLETQRQLTVVDFGSNFLADLTKNQTESGVGYSIWENSNVRLSIGADSTILIKLKNNLNLAVTGITSPYAFSRNGLIFLRDSNNQPDLPYGGGVLFTPLLGKGDLQNYAANGDYNFYPAKYKFWTYTGGWSTTWQANYNSLAGDAFILSVFPPKDFSLDKFCQGRPRLFLNNFQIARTSNGQVIDNTQDFEKLKYSSQVQSDYYSIANLWADSFMTANPIFDSSLTADDLRKLSINGGPILMRDFGGPYDLPNDGNRVEETRQYINNLKSYGLEVIAYMSPHFFYSNDPDKFIENLRAYLVKFPEIDGVYLDGYYEDTLMNNLKLVRKVRAELGDKIYIQHESANAWFFQSRYNNDASSFRVPFLDVFADYILTAETINKTDQNSFLNNYTGYNLSNTVTDIQPEERDITAYTPDVPTQFSHQLAHWARIFSYNTRSMLDFGDNSSPQKLYDSIDYSNQLNNLCLTQTCGNQACDVGESILNCSIDCAPRDQASGLVKNGNIFKLYDVSDLANWIINDTALFNLHYRFDDQKFEDQGRNFVTGYDYSGNKLDPYFMNGRFNARDEGSVPQKTLTLDDRQVYYFDGAPDLAGQTDNFSNNYQKMAIIGYYASNPSEPNSTNNKIQKKLDLETNNFSIFAQFKKNSTDFLAHTIFGYGQKEKNFLWFGLKNKKMTFIAQKNQDTSYNFEASTDAQLDGNWHSVGVTNDNSQIRLFIDGTPREISCTLNGVPINNNSDKSRCPIDSLSSFMDTTIEPFFSIGGLVVRRESSTAATHAREILLQNTLNGWLDDLFVSSQAMTTNLAQALHANGDPTKQLNQIYFPLGNNVKAIVSNGFRSYSMNNLLITVTKVADKTTAATGETITFTTTVINNMAETANNYIFTDPIMAQTTYVDGSAKINGQSSTSCGLANNRLVCELGSIGPNVTKSVEYKVTVN